MKKLYVVLLIIILTPVAVYAWNDCPYGLLNDPFPGSCSRYVDTNQDGICDHSQSPSSASTNTTSDLNTDNTSIHESNESVSDIQKLNIVPTENYYMVPLIISTLILYLVTYLLFLENYLSRRNYLRIWKYVLITSFIVTGVTGMILIIFINYGIESSWNLTINFWHVEFAIIMAVTTIFHFHLHWKQFKNVFKI